MDESRFFVRVRDHACSAWGVGKIIDVSDKTATVSWFDSPLTDPVDERIALEHLVTITLEQHTRVYWLDRHADRWRVGRILDADDTTAMVRFPNRKDLSLRLAELKVRWDKPLKDPSAFLAEQISESPFFSQARTQFIRSLIEQRGASFGMSGLISSIIDIEPHQYEVVKRVLQDPVQRYLLADEVGLGKTIEAGILIRQYVLDSPETHQILVITPPALLVQWRQELCRRFLLGDLLDDSLEVLPTTTDPQILIEALDYAGMVVIDEAHHLSQEPSLYNALREAIIAVPRLLLLSATPVLHNERGFLEMLHLLDPHVHRLEDEEAFRQRIVNRQALAESIAGLVPENLFQIEDYIDDLIERFPHDLLLHKHAESLRRIVVAFPDESDPAFSKALTTLRAHLTETYRLDRRILRNRRRDLSFLTPKRDGVEHFSYASSVVSRLIESAEAWRVAAAEALYHREQSDDAKLLAAWFWALLAAIQTDNGREVVLLARARLELLMQNRPNNSSWELEPLKQIERCALQCVSDATRLECLSALIVEQLKKGGKIIVFCSFSHIADTVAEYLQNSLQVIVDRHALPEDSEEAYENLSWVQFLSDPTHRVLICDASAEEGLNLQGGKKTIVHFDLPLSPNRIEQRLGRVDRYGAGDAIRSLALCCQDDPYAHRWLAYLSNGLRLFERSVASLQYLIEEEMQVLSRALLLDGVEALDTLIARACGTDGRIERELRRIDDQDSLDALTLPDESAPFEALAYVDGNWKNIAESVQQWMIDILQIKKEERSNAPPTRFGKRAFRFCFSYQDRGSSTLIPMKRLMYNTLPGELDTKVWGDRKKQFNTGWYSCHRRVVLSPSRPSEGIRLVRWGDSLIDEIHRFTSLDERGRATVIWRHDPNYSLCFDTTADLFLRFDFIVETDVSAALAAISSGSDESMQKALSRRGDMVLAPFYQTVWLDQEFRAVKDPDLRDLLSRPYSKAPNDHSYQDIHVHAERWSQLEAVGLATVDAWRQWIPEAHNAAKQLLRDETDLDQVCRRAVQAMQASDETRFAQLRARIHHVDSGTATATQRLLEQEKQVAEALHAAILAPRISLETVIAEFISPQPLTHAIDRIGNV
ncbi:protein DpdE [Magnetococcales bacterium HHB-1]